MSAPGERVALVSGGNRGIGLAVVRGLAAAGVSVVLGSRDSAAGQAARATIAEGDALVHVSALDVRDPRSVASCVAAVERDQVPFRFTANGFLRLSRARLRRGQVTPCLSGG